MGVEAKVLLGRVKTPTEPPEEQTEISTGLAIFKKEETMSPVLPPVQKPLVTKIGILSMEADVSKVFGEQSPLMFSFIHDNKITLVVTSDYCKNMHNPFVNFYHTVYSQEITKGYEIQLFIVPTVIEMIRKIFDVIYSSGVETVGIWNMCFDVETIMHEIKLAGYSPEVLVQPSIPLSDRKVSWDPDSDIPGSRRQKTPTDRNPQFKISGDVEFADTMCLYRKLNKDQQPANYALFNILDHHCLLREPVFDGVPLRKDAESAFEWHKHMQEKNPIAYMVHHVSVAIMQQDLDRQNGDLSHVQVLGPGVQENTGTDSGPVTPMEFTESVIGTEMLMKAITAIDEEANTVIEMINRNLVTGSNGLSVNIVTVSSEFGFMDRRDFVVTMSLPDVKIKEAIVEMVRHVFNKAGWSDIRFYRPDTIVQTTVSMSSRIKNDTWLENN